MTTPPATPASPPPPAPDARSTANASAQPVPSTPSGEPGEVRALRPAFWRRALGLPWTLRRQLTVAVIALLAIASLIVGFATVLSTQSLLIAGVDNQLREVVSRGGATSSGSEPGTGSTNSDSYTTPPGFIQRPGYSQGFIGAIYRNGSLIDAGYVAHGAAYTLPAAQGRALVAYAAEVDAASSGTPGWDGVIQIERPRTVSLGGQFGDYRMVVVPTPYGDYIFGLPLDGVDATVSQQVLIVLLISLFGAALAGLVAWLIVRLSLRPLDRVAATAAAVSQMPLDRGEVALGVRVADADADPRTEVGRVGSSINRMLGHVGSALTARQASESKVRQFVSDASHELRTPLASIRGYSELATRHSDALPDDVNYSLGRIQSESGRMTTIVEDLLLLARLDEGRELDRAPVDLTDLLIHTVNDAHAAAPDHVFELDIPDEPISVVGDAPRLHQVVANLLGNARVHTPAGTTVTASLALGQASTAVIEISDDGPGIDPELTPRLFERFTRGDDSRSRATGSTGLGLAIVHGVVQAHGGTVTAESRPGRTVFRVTLPLA